MERLIYILIVLCVFMIKSNLIVASESVTFEPSETLTETIKTQDIDSENNNENYKEPLKIEQRSIAELELPTNNADRHAAFRKRAKPLKSIFMGIYKNYKSTYLGNKTFAEYKRTLRTPPTNEEKITKVESDDESTELSSSNDADFSHETIEETETKPTIIETKSLSVKKKKKKQRARKRNHRRKKHEKRYLQAKKDSNTVPESSIYDYDFGTGVNMSLDLNNEIVKLHLDSENLLDIMQGRYLSNKNEGRGKKYEMITRVLPLFIIPFLIQSAVVPFLVTKLKLLLMKSILVGKLAIFLLVISAIKNSNKMMQTYEVAPSYWAGEPSRRSELAAAASSAAYNGYRVEGKPTAWIN